MENDKNQLKKKDALKKKKKQKQSSERDKYFAFYDDIKAPCQKRVDW